MLHRDASIFLVLFSIIGASFTARATVWSEDARALLPEANEVTLILKDGTTQTGQMMNQTPTMVTLKLDRGRGISFQKEFNRSDIKSIKEMNIADLIAPRLLAFKTALDGTPDDAQLAGMIALLREFTIKAPDHKNTVDIRALLDDALNQTENLKRGMSKIDGTWLPPVQAAIARIGQAETRMKEMEEKFSGITGTTYTANPGAKNFYDQLAAGRLELLQELPSLLGERFPVLLQQKQFDEAAAELNALHAFYAARIAGAGPAASRTKLTAAGAGPLAEMAMSDFFRMQQRFMEAYLKEHPFVLPEQDEKSQLVEIPAGYFIHGSTNTSAGVAYPATLTFVDRFRIDRHEVSNGEYRKFVDHTETALDRSIQHPDAPPLKNHRPASWDTNEDIDDNASVTGIDWFDAYAFAKFAGKRLPTAAEWDRVIQFQALFGAEVKLDPGTIYLQEGRTMTPGKKTTPGVRLIVE